MEKKFEWLVTGGITAEKLHTVYIEPRACFCGDWFRSGDYGMVYAVKGVGKTWLCIDIARGIATGTQVGPWLCPKPHNVLYVDGEMPMDLMQARIRQLNAVTPNLTILNHEYLFDKTGKVLNIADKSQQEDITNYLLASNTKVVFLDNLSCLASDTKESDADDWEKLNPWFLSLRRRHIAVVLLHHAGKSGLQRGTSRREDNAFWVIKLERVPLDDGEKGCRFSSAFDKNRNSPSNSDPYMWYYKPLCDYSSVEVNVQAYGQKVRMCNLIAKGVVNNKDLAKEMGVGESRISQIAKALMDEGRIRKIGQAYELINGKF
jgi:putative DNA primase/helicase